MSLKIRTRTHNNVKILHVTGEVFGADTGKLTQMVDRLCKGSHQTVAVNMSECSFIDSNGMGVFIFLWKSLKSQGKTFVFVDPHPFVKDMFVKTNLDKLFTIVDSEDSL